MAVKIKMRNSKMAVVKFTHPMDMQYFEQLMVMERDNGKPHPLIIIKHPDGKKIPPLEPPKQLTPEMIEQLKKQKPVPLSPTPVPGPPIGQEPKLIKPQDVKIDAKEKTKAGPNAES